MVTDDAVSSDRRGAGAQTTEEPKTAREGCSSRLDVPRTRGRLALVTAREGGVGEGVDLVVVAAIKGSQQFPFEVAKPGGSRGEPDVCGFHAGRQLSASPMSVSRGASSWPASVGNCIEPHSRRSPRRVVAALTSHQRGCAGAVDELPRSDLAPRGRRRPSRWSQRDEAATATNNRAGASRPKTSIRQHIAK